MIRSINELLCNMYFEILLFYEKRGDLKASKKWAKKFIDKYNKIHGTNLDLLVEESF